ncbi:MFS transporter [Clostridium felsineum]|uniref:MFS transporter n=1 Tax=Clostridium felsineum TaxID=36839 RepID=UPI00098CAD1F|nr:MFS transporter [Clostridium felsineum]URZ15669.1 hypothetical protein CLFE_017150 [Clostridium felsineum DSM 794]
MFKALKIFKKNIPYSLNVLSGIISSIGNSLTYLTVIQMLLVSNFNSKIVGIGLITLIRIIPPLCLSTVFGHLVDKRNRANILLLSDFIEGTTILSLVFVHNIYFIFFIFIINSIFDVFADIASFAYLDQLLEKEDIFVANSFFSSAKSIANCIGPALAGFIILKLGNTYAFSIDSVTFYFSVICTLICKYRYGKEGSIDLKLQNNKKNNPTTGIKYINENINLKYIFISMAIVVLIVEAQSPLMYIFGKQFLGIDVTKSSLFLTAMGIGSLISSFLFISIKEICNNMKFIFCVIAVDGISLIILTLINNFYVSLMCFTFFGMTSSVFFISVRNIIQLQVPNEDIGKVYSIQSFITSPLKVISILLGMYLTSSIMNTVSFFRYSGILELTSSIILATFYARNIEKKY